MAAAVANLEAGPPASALTGPVARGDVAAVAGHLAALLDDPSTSDVYRSLTLAAVELLRREPDAGVGRQGLDEIEALVSAGAGHVADSGAAGR